MTMDRIDEDQFVSCFGPGNCFSPRKQEAIEVIAAKKIYRDADGFPAIPTTCYLVALRGAGSSVPVGDKKISTAVRTNLFSIVKSIDVNGVNDPEMIRLILPEGTNPLSELPSEGGEKQNDPKSPWRMDVRQGRNKNVSGVAAYIRPRFNTWGFKLRMNIDLTSMDGLTIEHVYKLVRIASRYWSQSGRRAHPAP